MNIVIAALLALLLALQSFVTFQICHKKTKLPLSNVLRVGQLGLLVYLVAAFWEHVLGNRVASTSEVGFFTAILIDRAWITYFHAKGYSRNKDWHLWAEKQ